jgi:hypothetical protein
MTQSIDAQQTQLRQTFEGLKAALSTKYTQEVDAIRQSAIAASQVFRDQVADLKSRLESLEKSDAVSRSLLTSQTISEQMAQDTELRRIRAIKMKELQVRPLSLCNDVFC